VLTPTKMCVIQISSYRKNKMGYLEISSDIKNEDYSDLFRLKKKQRNLIRRKLKTVWEIISNTV
jgi:hypothetical protein